MDLKDDLDRLSPEQRALLALRLSNAKRRDSSAVSLPQVHPDPQRRYEPFSLSDIQQAYLIGRSDGVELGNISCQSYSEVDIADWDQKRFEAALQKLIQRHEMLRCIVLSDGRQQILQDVPPYRIKSTVLRGQEPAAAAAQLEVVRQELRHQVRPADRWPLFDFRVSHLDSRCSRLHISIDLLIADALSLEILFSELTRLYHNPDAILSPFELSFRDYLCAFNSLEDTGAFRESKAYWLKRLPSLPPAPELPLATNPASVTRPKFKRRHGQLDARTWRNIKKRAARIRLTPAGILLAAYAEVLAVWSKNPHFTINLTLFNRLPLDKEVNNIIGDFTSVTLLEVDIAKPETFEARGQRIQEQLWQDLDHRYFSGIRVMRELTRSQGIGPKAIMPVVFTSLLNLGDGNDRAIWAGKLGQSAYAISQTPQVCLDFIAHEERNALVINWDAVDELFPIGFLDDMFQGYQCLLEQLASDEGSWRRSLAENTRRLIPTIQKEVREAMNDTKAVLSDELLHSPFLKQVEERPDQIAVSTPTQRLTYEQLYRRACRIEEQLLSRGVEPNQLVAIVMEKGWEQVVAVLGILLAGGAYLPIDPELPAERQRYLLEHGEVKIVLTQSTVQHRLNVPTGVEVLAVDILKPADVGHPIPHKRQKPEDLAYVIYTSGSTGLPKGVMIDHRGALNTMLDINQRFDISPADRVLALSRLSFDLSVYDIFGLLAAGGTIVMPRADLALDVTHWGELVAVERVTIWNTVPALMQLLVDHHLNGERLGQSLRLIMMSGDWIPVSLPSQIRQVLPQAKIVSLGGATEGSIWSILYPIEEVDPNWKSIPYGKPMLNQTFHVLNHALAPCPVWVPGHLYIGGIGVAKGYWRDKQKTDASFVVEPVSGRRLYRTGDLGRYLPDGNIEFLGREDFQVKVQGYRIELGEIEVQLLGHKGVENCVVAMREDRPGEKYLVGYVIAKSGIRIEAADLREHLRQRLPEYMVPSAFVVVDRFPLTGNGKVDRTELPKPARSNTEMGSASPAPQDPLELQLTKLWERVLGVHPVGRKDNFFDLGGYSLEAVRLFAELGKIIGRSLPLSTLFQAPTVEKLADILRQRGWSTSWSSLVPIQPGGSRPPFFCVHGGGGNVLIFHDLARRLGSDYPFYGLQSRGVDGSKSYLTTVQEMASHYLKEIRELQPEGPYYLGGFCMGGQIAYEMALRLCKDEQRVAMLVLIDTYNFNGTPLRLSRRESLSRSIQKASFHWVNFMRLGPRERRSYLRRKLKGACGRELERISVKLSNLLRVSLGANDGGARKVFLEDINDAAYFAYVPPACDQKITIFKPQRNYSFLTKPRMGWNDVAVGGLDIIELPVNPGGIFVEPYVLKLAEKLRTLIDEAEAKSNARHASLASMETDANNGSRELSPSAVGPEMAYDERHTS